MIGEVPILSILVVNGQIRSDRRIYIADVRHIETTNISKLIGRKADDVADPLLLCRIAPCGGSAIEGFNIRLPLLHVHSCQATVISNETVDLALHIGRLGPDTSTACKPTNLILELGEEDVAAVVPCLDGDVDLVGLIDGVDGGLVIPEVFDGYIGAYPTEFTLEPNPGRIVGARGGGIKGRATLWVRVVVVILGNVNM